MNLVPNAFYIYVAEMPRSRSFYESIFDLETVFESPGYVAYGIGSGITVALWSGASDSLTSNPPRTSELGMNMTLTPEAIDSLHEDWVEKGATTVEAPHNAAFGRTFVVADPDGNLIRVAPVD